MNRLSGTTLILIGHGSTTNPDSSAPTRRLAEVIHTKGVFNEVRCCFWKEEPHLHDALKELESREIFIVPNFISEGYFTQTVIPRELALDGPITRHEEKLIYYCKPVGSHPSMTSVLLKRAAETAQDILPSETSLLLVGHGTNLHRQSSDAVKLQSSLIAVLGIYAEVLPCTMEPMEDVPLVSNWADITSQQNVVVLPFFISDGLHSYQDIPVLLGMREELGPAASESEVFKHNPHHLHGKNLYYGSAIGTDPMIAEVILDQVKSFDGLQY
ncbi:MAG: CbiX/SirB N-terminal domain-containing protein [bacterium]